MEERFRDWSLRFSWKDDPQSAFHGVSIEEDEKTVKRAMLLLLNGQKPPNIHEELKDEKHANSYIKFGHRIVKKKNWRIILEAYTQALMYAPTNSICLARSYCYCSIALFIGKLYKEALLSINRGMKIGPPDNIKSKIYVCQARCIFEMNGKKKCRRVQEAIDNARNWIGSIDENDVTREDIIKYINKLTNFYPLVERIETVHDSTMLTMPDDNEKIMQASSAFEIKFSDEYGRHIVASRDIKAGEILFAHKSYASTIYSPILHEYCWYCSKRVFAGVPCNQCPMVMFCDENCRDLAWEEHHDLECLAIPAMLEVNMDATELMTLRLLVKAYKEADCSIDKLRAKLIAMESIKDPIERLFTDGKLDNTKYASIFSLSRRFPILSTHAARASVILLFLAGTTNIFGKKIKDYLGLWTTEGTKFMGSLILRHIGICYNNAIGELQRDKSYLVRLQINPLLSLFNHSCDPSVLVHTHGDVKFCIAIKDIAEGEQIYRCYLPDDWNISLAKRNIFFLESFNFNCECRACQRNWRCYIRQDPPSHELQNYPLAVIEQWMLITSNFPLENDMYSSNLSLYSKFHQ